MIEKSILFIMKVAPHSGVQLQEKLDVVLTAAAFDQKVALLFLDDGVFQLKKDQQPEKLGLKETLSIFNALEIYDVNDLYTEVESLQERGLKPVDLSLPVKEFYRKDINSLMQQYDVVVC
ncbi:MAG: sulfurtransferase complex subunit TusC [Methylococcales bacterium]|nr:sulfurtransferase complex subunit TusC [Methylococcales bacterium]